MEYLTKCAYNGQTWVFEMWVLHKHVQFYMPVKDSQGFSLNLQKISKDS